ncbi:MAG: hypothetical protein L6277_02170 [Desulfobacterales bacterium]|nr:hypothetical protein [Pseudomonadota bacterium]MCG2770881.1 hypothetical protein [Desulfobacterales bacterium]
MERIQLFNSDDSLLLSFGNAMSAGFYLNKLDEEDEFYKIMPEYENSLSVIDHRV